MRNNELLRYEAVLEAIDEASGGDTPRHWSTWRHVIAAGICAAAEWTPPPPPAPRCPGCGTIVDGTEKMTRSRASTPNDKDTISVRWTCCDLVREYSSFRAFGARFEDADSYEPPS